MADTGPTLFGKTITTKGVPILNTTMNGADSFDGEGSSTQSNSLAGSLTVTVVDVQPNGNLVVQGDKTLKLNQGDEFVHIAGVITAGGHRHQQHRHLRQARRRAHQLLRERRRSTSSNQMGWLARFFNSPFAPF